MPDLAIIRQVNAVLKEGVSLSDLLFDRETGFIEKIAPAGKIDIDPNEVQEIDRYAGLFLFPGFIDPHVHFRFPGFEEAEDWASGSQVALFGGVTTVLEMPNTRPPTVDAAAAGIKLAHIRQHSLINYGIMGGFNGSNLGELIENDDFKAIKVFLGATTGASGAAGLDELKRFSPSKVFVFHAEKESIIEQNSARIGKIVNPWQHSQIRSEEAAIEAVKEVIELYREHPGNYHIAHVSTDREVDLLLESGLSFEAAPHHLYLSTDDYREHGFFLKCNPPLRSPETREKLYAHLHNGDIRIIATDHAPHPKTQKERTDIVPPSGIPSLAIGTHLILDETSRGKISPEKTASLLSTAAAERFGIQKRGRIAAGFYADFAIVNLHEKWTLQSDLIPNRCGWSPFEGRLFSARVKATFVNGHEYEPGLQKQVRKGPIFQV